MAQYRVDELARAADTSVRNVRVYQDRGLLPPPRRVGRTGIYTEAHLARLRLIRLLLQRGYTFATIGELLSAWSQGQGLNDLLHLDGVIAVPWSDETPTRLREADLVAAFGDFTEAQLHRAIEMGFVGRDDDGYQVPSPRLLEAGSQLVAAGVPLSAVLDLAEGLQDEMGRVAKLIFKAFAEHVASQDRPPVEVAEVLLQLRPFTQQAVEAILAMALTRESEQLLARRAQKARSTQSLTPAGGPE